MERVWRQCELQVPQRPKKHKIKTGKSVPCQAERPNHVWTNDFQEDALASGGKIRLLNIAGALLERLWTSLSGREGARRRFFLRGRQSRQTPERRRRGAVCEALSDRLGALRRSQRRSIHFQIINTGDVDFALP